VSQLYYGLVTEIGLAKLAAAAAGGPALALSAMAFGDGAGAETAPTKAATQLVNERYRALLIEKYPHPTNPSILYVEGVIPPGVGGWTMREAGIYDTAGDLIVIAKTPALNVALVSEGASTEGVVRLPIVFDSLSSVEILVDPTVVLATQSWVLERVLSRPFITVDSATWLAPPASPAAHALYLVPSGATGAWAGQSHKLAYFNGVWRFFSAPVSKVVGASDTGEYYRRTAEGWENFWVEKEVTNLLVKSGIGAAPGSGLRLAQAVRSQRMNFRNAAGTSSAISLTLDPGVTSHAETVGLPLRVLITNANPGAVTLDVGPGPLPVVSMRGGALRQGDLPAGAIVRVVGTGSSWQLEGLAYSEVPLLLRSGATIYVATDGNDNNDGQAAGPSRAFKTMNRAVAYAKQFTGSLARILCNVANGSYGQWSADGLQIGFDVVGNPGSPSSVAFTASGIAPGTGCAFVNGGSDVTINGARIGSSIANTYGLVASRGANVRLLNIDWGDAPLVNLIADRSSAVLVGGSHRLLSGNHESWARASSNATIIHDTEAPPTVNVVAVQNYSAGFVSAYQDGFVAMGGAAFVNKANAIGRRFYCLEGGAVSATGGGLNHYAGTLDGDSSQGRYFP